MANKTSTGIWYKGVINDLLTSLEDGNKEALETMQAKLASLYKWADALHDHVKSGEQHMNDYETLRAKLIDAKQSPSTN